MPANRNLTLDLKPDPAKRMAAFIGNWKHESHENVDAILDKLDLPDPQKQMIKTAKPTIEISKTGDTWKFITAVGPNNRTIEFKLGEPFENISLTGDKVQSVITLEGDAMIEKSQHKSVEVLITRQIVDGKLVSTMNAGGDKAVFTLARAS